jgi:hypothetical protein
VLSQYRFQSCVVRILGDARSHVFEVVVVPESLMQSGERVKPRVVALASCQPVREVREKYRAHTGEARKGLQNR